MVMPCVIYVKKRLTHLLLAFFHVNDVHAHLDEFNRAGVDCKDAAKGCFGGYARIKTKIDELRAQYPDNLWLNAGDESQGTLFYTFYGGEKIAQTINDLNFDAMTLGNHEWDRGDEKLGEFLKQLTFPVVSCNVKSTNKDLNETIKNYHIFEKNGVAVVGATTETTPSTANVGKETAFLDAIPEIQNTTKINRIVALTHLGYDADQKLAQQTEGLSLIIGGHSHTLLGDMDKAKGKYPTIVKDREGNDVFVVTSYRWGEYLGSIEMTFDKNGKAVSYHGAPIHMNNTTAQNGGLQEKIKAWRGPFEKFAAEVVGRTNNVLDHSTCRRSDCLLGQVVADAMLEHLQNQIRDTGDKPDFALINAGDIRATVDEGDITRGEILTAFPFGSAVTQVKFSGAELRKTLEGCVSRINQFNQKRTSSWFQLSSNIVLEYNDSGAAGSKLVNVVIGGKPLDDHANYHVVTTDFLAGGGDNLLMPTKDVVTFDSADEAFLGYVQKHTPLENTLQKRVVLSKGKAESGGEEKGSVEANSPRPQRPFCKKTGGKQKNNHVKLDLV
jgi:5'-nucleotidase